jgi:hypothetical protein
LPRRGKFISRKELGDDDEAVAEVGLEVLFRDAHAVLVAIARKRKRPAANKRSGPDSVEAGGIEPPPPVEKVAKRPKSSTILDYILDSAAVGSGGRHRRHQVFDHKPGGQSSLASLPQNEDRSRFRTF